MQGSTPAPPFVLQYPPEDQRASFSMPVDRLSGISFKDHPDFLLHLRKVNGGHIPDFGDIDTEVVVDKDMPHSSTILPGDRSVRFTKSGGKAVCCFPNDLDVIDYPGGEDMNALTGKWGEECGGVRAEGIEDE